MTRVGEVGTVQQPAALTAPTAGTYLLVHTEHGAELWRRTEDGDGELVDLVVPSGVGADRAHHEETQAAQQA